MDHSHLSNVITKGAIGTFTPFLAIAASWQEHLTWGLQILALGSGSAVSIVTLCSIIRAANKKDKDSKN